MLILSWLASSGMTQQLSQHRRCNVKSMPGLDAGIAPVSGAALESWKQHDALLKAGNRIQTNGRGSRVVPV
jgi:hypothetical protein